MTQLVAMCRRILPPVLVLLVLGAIFAAYLQPEIMVEVANQIALCF